MSETEALQEGITMMILFIAGLGILTAMFVNHFKKAEQHRQMKVKMMNFHILMLIFER